MNTQSMSGRFGSRCTAYAAALVMVLLGTVPASAIAEQHAATTTGSHVVAVPLGDVSLSTPEGMREARERLRAAVESVCAEPAKSRGLPHQPSLAACVETTLAAYLNLIEHLRQQHETVINSEMRATTVSLADLDLSTPEGARIARERLEATARHVCGELARRQDLPYEPNYVTCVQDSLARALAQVDALVAARNTAVARGYTNSSGTLQ